MTDPANPIGIDKTLGTIGDLGQIAIDGIGLAKAYNKGLLGWMAVLTGAVKLVADVKQLVADAPGALPELKDLSVPEAEQVGVAAYGCVSAIVAALAAP